MYLYSFIENIRLGPKKEFPNQYWRHLLSLIQQTQGTYLLNKLLLFKGVPKRTFESALSIQGSTDKPLGL